MRIAVAFAALLLMACTTQRQKDAAADDALNQMERAAESDMSPDELAAIRRDAEQSAEAKLEAAAAACGTKVHFTTEAKFEDRTVYIDPAATAEQLACVQKSFPFVQAAAH